MPFRWTYVALPAGFFLLSIVLSGIFYPQLPPEISYHFRQGDPDAVMARGTFIAWMIVPHVFFVILSFFIVRLMMLGARYTPPGETPLTQLLPVMGNMIALPQIILFIAALQFYLYNAYQTGIAPLWIISIIVLVLGGIILVVSFARVIRRFRGGKVKSTRSDTDAG